MTETHGTLLSAVAALVERAARILEADPGAFVLSEGSDDWERDPSDSLVFRRRNSTSPHLHLRAEENLRGSNEWAAARKELINSPTLGKVIDQLVGTAAGQVRVDGDGLLLGAVYAAMRSPNPSVSIKAALAGWQADYGSDVLEITTIAILDGFEANGTMELAQDVSLRPMSDREIALALRLGAMPVSTTFGDMAVVPSQSCAAVLSRLPVAIGPIETPPAAEDPYASARLSLQAVLTTLRLLGFARVRESAQITEEPPGSVTWHVGSAGPSVGITESMDPDRADRARDLYPSVRTALSGSARLAIALRRFSGSHEAKGPTDALLDLWIAMEAVFGPDDKTEITFRLAQTAANFVKLDGYSRMHVFQWIKRGYGVRSKLVHGREPPAAAMKRLDGTVASLDLVTQDLRFVLQEGLLKALSQGLPDSDGPTLAAD